MSYCCSSFVTKLQIVDQGKEEDFELENLPRSGDISLLKLPTACRPCLIHKFRLPINNTSQVNKQYMLFR